MKNIQFSFSSDLVLLPKQKYVFYVRAWYGDDESVTYVSDGVMIDNTAPVISKINKVLDLTDGTKSTDSDYFHNHADITVSWKNVFKDDESSIVKFTVNLLDTFYREVVSIEADATLTQATFTGLSLSSGNRYYSTVTAVNMAGLYSTAHSDGFQASYKITSFCTMDIKFWADVANLNTILCFTVVARGHYTIHCIMYSVG